MRTCLRWLLAVAILAWGAVAPGGACAEPPPPSEAEAADAVVAALAAKDTARLQALATAEKPDPWRVADVLLGRGEAEAARAFAQAAQRPALGRLSAYVASRKGASDDAPLRKALAAAREALTGKRHADAVAALGSLEQAPACVALVQALLVRGLALKGLQRPSEALASMARATEEGEKIGWLDGASIAAFQAGEVARSQSDGAGVLRWFGKASDLRVELGELVKAGNFHRVVASHFIQVGEYEPALAAIRRAMALFEKANAPDKVVLAHADLGVVYANMGDLAASLAARGKGAQLARAAGLLTTAAEMDAVRAEDLARTGEPENAVATARGVLALPAVELTPLARSTALSALAQGQLKLGRDGEAGLARDEALELVRAAKDLVGEGRLLTRLGTLYEERGDQHRALAERRAALAALEKTDSKINIATAQMNLGNSLLSVGELPASLRAFERALDLRQGLSENRDLAALLLNMALTLEALGDTTRAQAQQRRALEIYRTSQDAYGLTACLINLGDSLLRQTDPDAAGAEPLFQEALALGQQMGDALLVTQATCGLAAVAEKQGNLDAALAGAERALATARASIDQSAPLSTLTTLSEIRLRKGDLEGARAAAEEALALARRLGLMDHVVTGATNLCALELKAGRDAQALAAAEEALALLPSLVAGLSESQSAAGRSVHADVYFGGAQAALRLGRTADVLRFVELGRAAALVEGLRARDAIASATVPPALAEQEREARAAEALAASRWRAAVAAAKDAKGRTEAGTREAAWKAARERVRLVSERILGAARGAADGAYPRPATGPELQTLLASDQALLLYQTQRNPAYCLVVEKRGLRVVTLGTVEDIVAAASKLTRDDKGEVDEAAVRRLKSLVVEPLALAPGVTRLLLSPDGALAYLPFALLFPEQRLVHVPSATTWALLSEDRTPRGTKVLALADPDYSTSPETKRAGASTLRSGLDLQPLPASRDEARAVADVVLLGSEATEARFATAVAEQTRWRAVHLACHGWIDPDRPLLSALALTPTDDDDGFLTALEVFRLRVPADLVVLSACETGKGRVYAAEGIVGLTRAFMFAGSPRVLVSLWKVDDRATRLLMERFYAHWKANKPASEALALAQKDVREHTEQVVDPVASRAAGRDVRIAGHPYAAPAFWAGWALWGLGD